MQTAPSPANNVARATSTLPLDPARTTTPQPVCSAGLRMEPWRSPARLASWTFMAIPLRVVLAHSSDDRARHPCRHQAAGGRDLQLWGAVNRVAPWTGRITCVRERTCGANWYQ